ncbi:hypothetical protein KAH37_00480 [bacterium]|nr:hypothetical protein [bacterium]
MSFFCRKCKISLIYDEAADFLKAKLPAEIAGRIDFSHIEVVSSSRFPIHFLTLQSGGQQVKRDWK